MDYQSISVRIQTQDHQPSSKSLPKSQSEFKRWLALKIYEALYDDHDRFIQIVNLKHSGFVTRIEATERIIRAVCFQEYNLIDLLLGISTCATFSKHDADSPYQEFIRRTYWDPRYFAPVEIVVDDYVYLDVVVDAELLERVESSDLAQTRDEQLAELIADYHKNVSSSISASLQVLMRSYRDGLITTLDVYCLDRDGVLVRYALEPVEATLLMSVVDPPSTASPLKPTIDSHIQKAPTSSSIGLQSVGHSAIRHDDDLMIVDSDGHGSVPSLTNRDEGAEMKIDPSPRPNSKRLDGSLTVSTALSHSLGLYS